SKIQSFELFKAAIGNPEYLTEITKDKSCQANFLMTIDQRNLSLPDILESIQIVKNQEVQSLLIIYLLRKKEYVTNLKGNSFLNRLNAKENHIPSRLNALVHQLDLKTLTTSMIEQLEPEAAVSILCSVPHFHQLTREQTEALITRYPKHEFIAYWIYHFALMPNAHNLLAHLMKCAGTNIVDELIKMDSYQKDLIISNIIEIAIFYENNRINTQRMAQNIQLNPVVLETEKESGLLQTLLNIRNTPIKPQKQLITSEEHSFTEELMKYNRSINCFEYFLLHYQGSSELITRILDEYMAYYEQPENSKNRTKLMHHISFMLTRSEMNTLVKEAIFTSFLQHPFFFDEQISYQLFLFDAKRILRYFGLKGGEKNYQRVIDLCTVALRKLHSDKNQDLIQVAQKALFEAKLELSFTRKQGFFSNLIKFIRRCWIYGWRGFFKPNSPEYVVSESLTLEKNNLKLSKVKNRLKNNLLTQEPENDLSTLLNKTEPLSTQEQYADLIKALDLYSLQAMPKNEFTIRQQIHNLYHHAINTNKNGELYRWLQENQNPFVLNQFHLLELAFKEKSYREVQGFMEQVNQDSDQLKYVSDELNCMMPELRGGETPISEKDKTPTDFVVNTSKILSECVSGASEFVNNAKIWTKGFASGLFAKINHKEDEDGFIVEHIDSFHQKMNT
ncbi:MAG: hypothetical protein HYX60_02455, partial [Legionella longbeachae]|nr:hypothetical protein [Legionella longbeachae]